VLVTTVTVSHPRQYACHFSLQTPDRVGCSPFSTIAGEANTVVSSSANGMELVNLSFTFNWLGVHPIDRVYVSANGYVNVDKDNNPSSVNFANTFGRYGFAFAIDAGANHAGAVLPPHISVAQEDLIGNVYTRHITSPEEAFVISWESAAFEDEYGSGSVGQVNAQVVL
jgi:hypothetical protein